MAGKILLTSLLRLLILAYRYSLSYFLGRHCRFMPSCSVYADEALKAHGPFKGTWIALKRFGRCHPWGGAGYDPVPTPSKKK
jgi:putative membrane protein insertion efficiency factor